jgi:hypothetical protein
MKELEEIEKYAKEGISIQGDPVKGYTIFTVPTQHFRISSLSELTSERFEEAQRAWKELEEMQNQSLSEFNKSLDSNL